ncbi:MAG: hypothetical protein GY874_06165 [Desulfobacteraceae bacterium]|nr:hypothetical protein [Desulfobacteraceae bacterium]
MTGAISSAVLIPIQKTALQQPGIQPQLQPEAQDGIRFEKAMGIDSYTLIDNRVMLNQNIKDPSMGDAVLNGIENVRTHMKKQIKSLIDGVSEVDGDKFSLLDTARFNIKMMSYATTASCVSKFAEKTSKGIQLLYKPQ